MTEAKCWEFYATSLVSIVEDDQFFRESMRRPLRSQGYSVEAFASAADFLASPRLKDTAALIADINMPAMTGIELYKHLINVGHVIPIILVTAYPNDIDRTRALHDGVVCYLTKPVNDDDLTRCLRKALRSGELSEEDSLAFGIGQGELNYGAIEGGGYRVVVSLTRTVLWLLSLGIFGKAYANATAGSTDEHTYIAPDLFAAETPLGTYQE